MKIGFVGLGHMGAPMARNLLKAGHSLVVFDVVAGPDGAARFEGVLPGSYDVTVSCTDHIAEPKYAPVLVAGPMLPLVLDIPAATVPPFPSKVCAPASAYGPSGAGAATKDPVTV